jgi:hypothetical protein
MAAIMVVVVRTAVTIGVFTLLATAIIVAGCNKRPAAQVSQLTNQAQAPRLTHEEIRQKILAASLANYTGHARAAVPMTCMGNRSAILVM